MNKLYKKRFFLLEHIRGGAALLVLFYHFFIFFFTEQVFYANLLQAQPLQLIFPKYLEYFINFPINIGYLGVSFFFLISGFLIQPSLQHYPSWRIFLKNRFLRLWPTYSFCFIVSLLFVSVFSYLSNKSFPYTFSHLIASIFWVRDLLNYSFIDGALWTLEIQIKFYLLSAIIWYGWRNYFLERMIVLNLILVVSIYLCCQYINEFSPSFYLVILWVKYLRYSSFILLGACGYQVYTGRMSWLKAILMSVCLLLLFLSPGTNFLVTIDIKSFCFGFCLFLGLIFSKGLHKKRKGFFSNLCRKMSVISYPLYLTHVVPGYTIIYLSQSYGFTIYQGTLAALGGSFLIAYLISGLERHIRYAWSTFHSHKKAKLLPASS
jgi:peptidoglycan/LPS O-acetylase OafA/YrhL